MYTRDVVCCQNGVLLSDDYVYICLFVHFNVELICSSNPDYFIPAEDIFDTLFQDGRK